MDLIVLLGHVHVIGGDYPAARSLGHRAIELDPDDPRGYSVLAWATISDPDHSPTDAGYRPHSSEAGKASQDRIITGRQLVARCLQLDPHEAGYFALLAQLEFLSDNPTAALEAANKGLRVDPSHSASAHARMRSLGELRRLQEAVETGLERLRVDPEDAVCHHHLAQVYLEQGELALSTRHARQAVRLAPNESLYRQTYWDAIKATNPFFRPFVYWQFIAKRLGSVSENWKTVGLIAIPAASGGLAAIAQHEFGFEGAPVLVVLAVGLGTFILASERPCMALVDLAMYASDREYRATVDRQEMAITAAATVTALVAIVCFILAGFLIYTPLFAFCAALIFAAPVFCLFHTDSVAMKAGFAVNLIVMAVCLWFAIDTYQESRANTTERLISVYGFMGFLFAGITGPILYGHYKFERHA